MVKNPPGSLLTWRESISSATTFIDCSHSMRFRMLPAGNMNGSILQGDCWFTKRILDDSHL